MPLAVRERDPEQDDKVGLLAEMTRPCATKVLTDDVEMVGLPPQSEDVGLDSVCDGEVVFVTSWTSEEDGSNIDVVNTSVRERRDMPDAPEFLTAWSSDDEDVKQNGSMVVSREFKTVWSASDSESDASARGGDFIRT